METLGESLHYNIIQRKRFKKFIFLCIKKTEIPVCNVYKVPKCNRKKKLVISEEQRNIEIRCQFFYSLTFFQTRLKQLYHTK